MYYKYIRPHLIKEKRLITPEDNYGLYLVKLEEGLTEEEFENDDTVFAIPIGDFYAVREDAGLSVCGKKDHPYASSYSVGETSDEEADNLWYDQYIIENYLYRFIDPLYPIFVYSKELDEILACDIGELDGNKLDVDNCIIDTWDIIQYLLSNEKEPFEVESDE